MRLWEEGESERGAERVREGVGERRRAGARREIEREESEGEREGSEREGNEREGKIIFIFTLDCCYVVLLF